MLFNSLRPNPSALLNPRVDPIFKSLFTQNTECSQKALESFLSAIFNEKITDIILNPNELPIESEKDKQSVFDLTCHLGEEKKVLNIEMQGQNTTSFFDNRSEYYASHLLNHNVRKGMLWEDVPSTFMISVMNFIYEKNIYEPLPLKYSMKLDCGTKLKSQKLNIIYIELPKYKKIPDTPVENLTSIERWAKFFIYAEQPEKSEYIKKLAQVEDGIMNAQEALAFISQEEREWRRERNYWDSISTEKSMIHEAEIKGISQGINKTYLSLIQKKLAKGLSIAQIASEIELPIEETQNLVSTIK